MPAPFHPCPNVEAEKAVCSFKDAMRKQSDTTDINLCIANFLQTQHS